jgi:SET domain-containing protein 6
VCFSRADDVSSKHESFSFPNHPKDQKNKIHLAGTMTDTFNWQSSAFLNWLSNSGAEINPKIEIADLRDRNAGRGVGTPGYPSNYSQPLTLSIVAAADIDQDEVLFSIPRSIVLSVQNSSFRQEHADLLSPLADEPWLSLILVMLYEYGRGSESNWKSYFDILPSNFDTLMYWSENELAELQASAVVKKIGKQETDQVLKDKIWPILHENPGIFGFQQTGPSKEEVLELAHQMGSLIMAYAFDIESSDVKEPDEEGYATEDEDEDLPKGMVPLADILNADADRNNVSLHFQKWDPEMLISCSFRHGCSMSQTHL